jgi:hypothetical protein
MKELRCPRCQRDIVQRVHRRWIIERVLSLYYIYPFRCQLCGHRFRAQQWGMRYLRQVIDQRQYMRMATSFPATFTSGGRHGEGVVVDIALGGCGLRTTASIAEGALLQVQLQPVEHAPGIPVEAAVVRTVEGSFVGLEFVRLESDAHVRLSQLMSDLLRARQGTAHDRTSMTEVGRILH